MPIDSRRSSRLPAVPSQIGVARGGGDAPPVRVATVDRGLDQAAGDNARATALASASLAAPLTWHVMSVVAPSPSAACWRASDRATASTRRARSLRPALTPAAPDASRKTVSFVLVSPSTVSWFHVRSTIGARTACSSAGSALSVGQDQREHRRHARMNHPDALADAGHGHRPQPHRGRLRARVGRAASARPARPSSAVVRR